MNYTMMYRSTNMRLTVPFSKSFKYPAFKTWEFISVWIRIFKILIYFLKCCTYNHICFSYFLSLIPFVIENFTVYMRHITKADCV